MSILAVISSIGDSNVSTESVLSVFLEDVFGWAC